MKPDLIVKIEVPTTLINENTGEPRHAVGTAYPLRDGLVITARHVLYHKAINPDGERVLSWRHGNNEPPYFERKITASNILHESEEFDVALIEVETPESTPTVTPCRNTPETKAPWEVVGYAKGGKVADGQREKLSADGTFFKDTGVFKRHLDTGESPDADVWKGMSGAPVFKLNTNELAGIVTHGKEALSNRLMMTSLSWLLAEGNWPEFRACVLGNNLDQLIDPPKTGDAFRQHLIAEISDEIEMWSESNKILCSQLMRKLRIRGDDINEEAIAESLVDQGPTTAVDILTDATLVCLERSKKAELSEEVKETAQQVLGWLVLSSLDESQLSGVRPHCVQHDSFFFTLAVKSLTGVEVVMARRFNRQLHLEHKSGSEQKSRHLIEVATNGLKWDEEESTWLIFSEVWNRLFPNEKLENRDRSKPEKWNWSRLNAEIKRRRSRSSRAEHYYIPFKASQYESAGLSDYVVEVYQHFLSKLDQLTVIQYGEAGNDDNLFFVTEDDLLAAINDFYLRINGE